MGIAAFTIGPAKGRTRWHLPSYTLPIDSLYPVPFGPEPDRWSRR